MAVIKVKTQKVSGGGGVGEALRRAGGIVSSATKKKKCKDGSTASSHGGKCPENKTLNELDEGPN